MKLKALLAATVMATSAHAYEAQPYFAEAVNLWDNVYFSNKQIKYDAKSAYIPEITWNEAIKGGWCNELVHYVMNKTGQLDDIVDGTTVWAEEAVNGQLTLRGRHLVDLRNDNVTTQHKSDGKIKLKAGDMVLLDWDGSPNYNLGSYGIDHVSLYLGPATKKGWSWFLGGNQNGHLQPKLYEDKAVTFASRVKSDNVGESDSRYFADIDDGYIRIEKLEVNTSDWSLKNTYEIEETDILGKKFNNGFKGNNQFGMSNKLAWDLYGLQIQEITNDAGKNLYVQTDKELHAHGELIVTQEYKDMFSETIADVIRENSNEPDKLKEKLVWVDYNTPSWNRKVWKQLRAMNKTDANGDNPNFYRHYMKLMNDFGMNNLADGFKKHHRYAGALHAVKEASAEDNLKGAFQDTYEGFNRLEAWSDDVVDDLLDHGFVMDDYKLHQKVIGTLFTPVSLF